MKIAEIVARAIATADEQNGGPPYEYRLGMGKHTRAHLFDEAEAVIEALKKAGWTGPEEADG